MDEPEDTEYEITEAVPGDATGILEVQRLAFTEEMREYGFFDIPPITETVEDIKRDFENMVVLKATIDGAIGGSVRVKCERGTCLVGKLSVHPRLWNKGLGTSLMLEVERACPDAQRFELFTGSKSLRNMRLYEKLGYRPFRTEDARGGIQLVYMEKTNKRG
ncbi:MAG: GNAT family N-acetyltransferase [Candidatus Geothermincolia bacterium]